MLRKVVAATAGLAVVYIVVLGSLFALMLQPPPRFAAVIAKVPGFLFSLVPFRSLWTIARAGHLSVGDPAPDFHLEAYDRRESVTLSSLRGQKPVVLVFGSYT